MERDIILLVVGAAVSIPLSIVSSWMAGPLLTTVWHYNFAALIVRGLWWTADKFFKSPSWEMEWHVQSARFPPVNISTATVHSFLNVVLAEWSAVTTAGTTLYYRMVATVSGSTVTGRWFDKEVGRTGYLGALQLIISPVNDEAAGRWVGFSTDGSVKADRVVLRRLP